MLTRFRRLPIGLRVTLVFTGVMALVLAGVGVFVYVRLGAELDASIDRSLRSRAVDVTALVEHAGSGLSQPGRSILTERGENLAQVLTVSGRVIDSTPTLPTRPLLSPTDLRTARSRSVFVTNARAGERARILATPAEAQGQRMVVVVGAPLDERSDAVHKLGGLLLLGGPLALLLAALAGFGALSAALRPVERMRRRAAAIDEASAGDRLPVPAADDVISRLGTTLNEMLERLEASVARERRFVSDASHELRTPLTVLKGELEIALLRERGVDELTAYLRSAAEETDRLVQLAEDLLVIARAEQGRLPIRSTELSIDDLLGGVAQRFEQRAREQGVDLAVAAPIGKTIVADPLRLEQALANLVDNALRHGGRRIELTAVVRDGEVELHVSDDGDGFPPDFIDAAFERFTRADTTRARGGAGLGLSIVEAIAHAHLGHASASNRQQGGADVWIGIPQRAARGHGAAGDGSPSS